MVPGFWDSIAPLHSVAVHVQIFESEKIQNVNKNVEWPKIDLKNLSQDKTKYVIQINGKTRQIIEQKKDLDKEELILLIKKDQKLSKYVQKNSKFHYSCYHILHHLTNQV